MAAKRFQPLENDDNGVQFEIDATRNGLKARLAIKGWRWWTLLGTFLSGSMAAAWKLGALLREWLQ